MHPITTHSPYCIEVSLQRKCAVVHSLSRQRLDVLMLSLVDKFRRVGANNGRGPTLRRTTCVRGGPSMGPAPHPAVQAVASSTTARIDLVSAFCGFQVERYHAADSPGVYNRREAHNKAAASLVVDMRHYAWALPNSICFRERSIS